MNCSNSEKQPVLIFDPYGKCSVTLLFACQAFIFLQAGKANLRHTFVKTFRHQFALSDPITYRISKYILCALEKIL